MADTTDTFAETSDPEPQQLSDDGEPAQPEFDIEALAEKVYRLMLAEIRLDRARGLASEDGE
jgi:hypothetical protein